MSIFSVTFISSSVNAFNLVQSKILSFGKELSIRNQNSRLVNIKNIRRQQIDSSNFCFLYRLSCKLECKNN